jgi:hypothetical protein
LPTRCGGCPYDRWGLLPGFLLDRQHRPTVFRSQFRIGPSRKKPSGLQAPAGSGAFVERLLRVAGRLPPLDALAQRIARHNRLVAADLWSGPRTRPVSRVRQPVCQWAAVKRFLRVTTPAVNRAAWAASPPEAEEFLEVVSAPMSRITGAPARAGPPARSPAPPPGAAHCRPAGLPSRP